MNEWHQYEDPDERSGEQVRNPLEIYDIECCVSYVKTLAKRTAVVVKNYYKGTTIKYRVHSPVQDASIYDKPYDDEMYLENPNNLSPEPFPSLDIDFEILFDYSGEIDESVESEKEISSICDKIYELFRRRVVIPLMEREQDSLNHLYLVEIRDAIHKAVNETTKSVSYTRVGNKLIRTANVHTKGKSVFTARFKSLHHTN